MAFYGSGARQWVPHPKAALSWVFRLVNLPLTCQDAPEGVIVPSRHFLPPTGFFAKMGICLGFFDFSLTIWLQRTKQTK